MIFKFNLNLRSAILNLSSGSVIPNRFQRMALISAELPMIAIVQQNDIATPHAAQVLNHRLTAHLVCFRRMFCYDSAESAKNGFTCSNPRSRSGLAAMERSPLAVRLDSCLLAYVGRAKFPASVRRCRRSDLRRLVEQ